ncbi:MAG: hypothetical protein IK078_09290 [Lachnospiraceae bacterium]|nr:hypothetical protein [Lachnospiraceae bacterium]
MVDELTNESFQTGKAIVTVSVELIKAIADACKQSMENRKNLTPEQKDSIFKKVTDLVVAHYKESHGSLKTFNREGKDVAHLDVSDERAAQIVKEVCQKNGIPVDMKETPRADGSCSYVAFCEVKNIDQLSAVLKMASQQVLEEQKAMSKELVLLNDKQEVIMSQSFVKDTDIDYDKLEKASKGANAYEIRDNSGKWLHLGYVKNGEPLKERVEETAKGFNPKQPKSLKETIREKKELSVKKDMNRQRQRTKQKNKNRHQSR